MTPRKRSAIIALSKTGVSIHEIAAEGYGSESAIGSIVKRFDNGLSTSPAMRTGRPKASSSREDCILIGKCLSYRRLTSKVLSHELFASTGCQLSARTVQQRLFSAGLKSCCPAKKPFINSSQCLQRLKWCQDWTVNIRDM